MIRINLLPVRHSRRQEAVKGEIVVALIGLALICVAMSGMYLVVHGELSEARAQNRVLQQGIDKTLPTFCKDEAMGYCTDGTYRHPRRLHLT